MLNLVRRPRTDGLPGEELVLRFDEPEARGTLILRECAYGLEIVMPALHPDPVALLDLYYAASVRREAQARSTDAEPDPACQIILHSPAQTEDPVGRVRCFADHTAVDFEPGVTHWRSGAGATGSTYGYALADYPPVVNAHGLADWQHRPRCSACDEPIPPEQHSHTCIICGALLCNPCFSARARCPCC